VTIATVLFEEAAPAKVNLFLHVTGRRADGYHLLDSLAVFPAVADRLTVRPGAGLSLGLAGPFGASLDAEPDNLVLRAARALAEVCGVPALARLELEKHLPVASGIGGGSADAAAALRLLTRLWGVAPTEASRHEIAAGLGADVPVCLASRPARMGGVGEALGQGPDIPRCGLALVNPGVALATAAVFRARAAGFSPPASLPASWANAATMAADLGRLGNDLQAPAIALCPVIGAALNALTGSGQCLLARMSGSGATCFGLYPDAAAAEVAAASVRAAHPAWWVWGGALNGL
jgi:4-diphosphocytidyl-2-C-methyl-D-erythritol kinase